MLKNRLTEFRIHDPKWQDFGEQPNDNLFIYWPYIGFKEY